MKEVIRAFLEKEGIIGNGVKDIYIPVPFVNNHGDPKYGRVSLISLIEEFCSTHTLLIHEGNRECPITPKMWESAYPKEGKYIMGMDVAKGPDSSSSVLLKKVGGGVFEVQRDLCKSGALLPSNPNITKSPD